MTIQELAAKYAAWFETATRNNDTDYIRLRTEDEDIKQLIRDAHSDMMPDDYKYQYVHDALEAISNCDNEDDIIDISMEPDVYNSDLLKWISSHLTRSDYFDQAVENFGYETFFNTMMLAQQMEREEVLHSVVESLRSILEGIN